MTSPIYGEEPSTQYGRIEPGMFLGQYEVLMCVARGGMASVWAARQHGARGFSKLVAVKAILPELAVPEFEAMFLEEARLAARVRHPNVCEIFELIEHDGMLALSMEWIDGDTLAKLLSSADRHGPLPARIGARIVAEAARGLHAAHELRDDHGLPMNVVHRDVSPQNILISSDGQVKVADFGIAKALGSTREATAVGRVKGKLNYMSPEQARGRVLDRRSDVFSLGVVLYLATVGRHPFRRDDDSPERQMSRLLGSDLVLPSQALPSYPLGLETIVLRAMNPDPARRYATAADLRMALEEWLLQSGALVSDQEIAHELARRAGSSIEQRDARVQARLRQSRARATGEATRAYEGLTRRPSSTAGGVTLTTPLARKNGPFALWAGAALGVLAVIGAVAASHRSNDATPHVAARAPLVEAASTAGSPPVSAPSVSPESSVAAAKVVKPSPAPVKKPSPSTPRPSSGPKSKTRLAAPVGASKAASVDARIGPLEKDL